MKHPQQTTALRVDVKELKGSPGTSETLDRTIGAPADFTTVLVGIPEHSDLQLNLRFDSVHEGVLATGTASAQVLGQCGRCLDALNYPLTVNITQLFHWAENVEDNEEETTRWVEEDLTVDLEEVLRDLMVSELPFTPVCSQSCPGLCSECGFRMEDDPEHAHEQHDPRWAALAGLAEQLEAEDEKPAES